LENSTLYSDKELFLQIAGGDEQAFERLFDRYVPALQPYLQSMVKSRQATEDILQNTFIRIWLYRDRLQHIDHPRTWITRIAVHECLNYLRKTGNEQKAVHGLQVIMPDQESYEPDIQYHQTRQFIQEAVAQLSPQRRKVYEMSRQQGLSAQEIATQLQLSVQTVKNTLAAGIESIRQYLQSKGIIIPASIALHFFIHYL
jgi:RNA polymerase sigma-70 factor (family 1)